MRPDSSVSYLTDARTKSLARHPRPDLRMVEIALRELRRDNCGGEALQGAIRIATRLCRVPIGAVVTPTAARDAFDILAAHPADVVGRSAARLGLLAQVLRSGRPFATAGLHSRVRPFPPFSPTGIRGILVVPIRRGATLGGLLFVASKCRWRATAYDRRLLVLLAECTSDALEEVRKQRTSASPRPTPCVPADS